MMGIHRKATFSLAALVAIGLAAACSGRGDVEVGSLEPTAGSPPSNDAGPPQPISSGSGSGAPTPPPDSGAPDATDARAPDGDAPGPPPSPCDADGDGVYAEGRCGGPDCCDADPRVFPRDTDDFFTEPNVCGDFRYLCARKVQVQYARVRCRYDGACTGSGFTEEVACGERGAFVVCRVARGRCAPDYDRAEMRVQGCR